MTSLINPNNIDGAYPVAGQDNNSQGFRDNFTNTKTNFQYAAEEITDLQNKAVLKAALTGTTLNNDMNGSVLSNAQLQDISYTRVALGTLSGSITINYAAGNFQTLTTSGNISLNFINFPAAGTYGEVSLEVTVQATAGDPHQITLPSSVSVNTNGVTGLGAETGIFRFNTPGVYSFTISTSNGGSTYTFNETNNILVPFNRSFESLGSGNIVDNGVTNSVISTGGTGQTATLQAGVNGSTKIFTMLADGGGDMVVTVVDCGWKSSGNGTVTLNSIGQTITLRHGSGKWFVIGMGPNQAGSFPVLG
jgi:hypothetical protein